MGKLQDIGKGNGSAGLKAFACLLIVGSFLALSLVVAKLADAAGAPRLSFLMVALLVTGLLLMGLAIWQRNLVPLNLRVLEYALVTGAFLALPNALGFLAVRHVGAGFLSMSYAFPILLTWLMAVVLGMEAARGLRLLGVLLGLAGGVILASGKVMDLNGATGWVILVLAMPLALAAGNIFRTLRWPTGASPIYLAALMMFGAVLSLLPFVLYFEPGQLPQLILDLTIVKLLLLEILVFSVLYFFYFVLQKLAGPVYLSQIGIVAAVVGALIAILMLGEAAPSNLALAGSLVLAGTVIFQLSAPKGMSEKCSP
ncbi:DMT family transporter [Nitrincola alkalilacustris]|uniref:DMT family transporter n=1 Tax=Nitrincola alkalilacustris TaxID=1571224 RepID=UPI00124E2567|nr:DMT family transporter [Nitrincola alkalilacustris]